MAIEQKKAEAKTPSKIVAVEGVEKPEQMIISTQQKVTEAVAESAEKVQLEAEQSLANVHGHIQSLKKDLLQRIELLKRQFSGSQQNFDELKTFVKSEFTAVIEDLSKFGQELKKDVTQISGKHKEHLTETFKRSKENTLDVWKKVTVKDGASLES